MSGGVETVSTEYERQQAQLTPTSTKKAKKGDEEDMGSSHSHSHHSLASGEEGSLSLISIKTGCLRLSPGSTGSQKLQMIQMICLPFIPIAALIVQNSTILSAVMMSLGEAHEIQHQVQMKLL
jgi:hypothetical protein